MLKLTPEALWNLKDTDLVALINTGTFKPISHIIRVYAPSFTYYRTKHFCSSTKDFPTISITGNACALNCKHCGGKILQTMSPALNPIELYELGIKFKRSGAKGCLVSGGCMPNGCVPLEKFIPTLERFKRELGLTVFVHSGVITSKTALLLKEARVDAVLIDVIGSEKTLQKVYNLTFTTQNFAMSLKSLEKAKLNFVPHVIVGLNEGKLDGELAALRMISHHKPSALVIIAFMPIRGTVMEAIPPCRPIDIAKVSATARLMFPDTPIVLGCMRPKGKNRHLTDILALQTGIDAIAFPSEEALTYVKKQSLKLVFSSNCCAQIYDDAIKNEHY
jgi:lipoyl synthase